MPLKKKVRGERSKSSKSKGTKKATGATVKPKLSAEAKESGGAGAATTTGVIASGVVKRNKSTDEMVAPKRQKKVKAAAKKEIIDYSKRLDNGGGGKADMSAFGKVQQWLLESPSNATDIDRGSVLSEVNTGDAVKQPTTTEDKLIRKSVSTPERLVNGNGSNAVKMKAVGIPRGSPEKVKLHVVYKPPFKFSLKLAKKPLTATTTTVTALPRKKRNAKANNRLDGKNRIGIMSSSSQDKSTVLRKNRLALLIRTDEPDNEDSDKQQLHKDVELEKPLSAPVYENVNLDPTPVNAATFRIKKSASGSKVPDHSLNTVHSSHSSNKSNTKHRNRDSSMEDRSSRSLQRREADAALLRQFGGSSGNLVLRSSTTNLAKMQQQNVSNQDFQKNQKGRNSLNMQRQNSTPVDFKRISGSNSNVLLGRTNATATNVANNLQNNVILFKKLSTSNTNLAKFSDEFLAQKSLSNTSLNKHGSESRRTSTGGSSAKRRSSVQNNQGANNKSNRNSLRRSSIGGNNIPRASLKSRPRGSGQPPLPQPLRPHTASCDTAKPFEWKPRLDEPLASDLEVFCSDVENVLAADHR